MKEIAEQQAREQEIVSKIKRKMEKIRSQAKTGKTSESSTGKGCIAAESSGSMSKLSRRRRADGMRLLTRGVRKNLLTHMKLIMAITYREKFDPPASAITVNSSY